MTTTPCKTQTSPPYDHLTCCVSLLFVQILFVSGLSFVIGLERTFRFFFQKHKVKATSFFLGGVFVVLIGWPIIGVVLEIYGFFLLFRSAQTERKQPPSCHGLELMWTFWSHLVLSCQQRVLPGGSRLHQTSSCARVFAQLTWDQRSKYINTINGWQIERPFKLLETLNLLEMVNSSQGIFQTLFSLSIYLLTTVSITCLA